MRLNINLATQPYEDARQFFVRWGTALCGLLILAVFLCTEVFLHVRAYHKMSVDIAREQQLLHDFDAKQTEDLAILNQPVNKDVREQSAFLNDLILRKQLSWTRIFSDLEKLMPANLRVLSMQPKLDEGDRITVTMAVGGDSRDRAAELVRRMEHSRIFHNAQVVAERDNVSGQKGPSDDKMQFQITADYVPLYGPMVSDESNAGGGK